MLFDRRARVLIADADPVIRRSLNQRLIDAEVLADTVEDGKGALEKLHESRYAVVVLDLQLQQVSAERVIDWIAALPVADRPVVLVLAPRSAARSLDVDVVQIVLRKPFDLNQLAEVVQSCVRNASEALRRQDAAVENLESGFTQPATSG